MSSDDIDENVARVRVNRVACGPISVWYCLRRLGGDANVEDVIRNAQLADDGIGALQLVALCRSYGLTPRAVVCSRGSLAELPVPAILFIDDRH